MRCKRARIDSLNLSDKHLEAMFIYNENYSIEAVKSKSVFRPKRWSEAFGKPLTKNIIEAKIIHSYLGLCLPLKTFAVTLISQTVEFAGLHGYNERSRLLVQTFRELKSQLQHTRIMRIDVAIDYESKIPNRIVNALSKHREPFQCDNTTYYKTAKEKKTNSKMNIIIYDKALKEKLDYPLHRLEFSFRTPYFNKMILDDLDLVIKKMEKSIKKATGLTVRIEDI